MEKEAAEKLCGDQCHRPLLATMRVVLVSKGDALSVEGYDSVIGNGDSMSVAAKVPQHVRGAAESGFSVNHPILPVHPAQELSELFWRGECGGGSRAVQLAPPIKTLEASEKLAPEDAAEYLDRQEEGIAGLYPTPMICREASRRDHAVDVRMQASAQYPEPRNHARSGVLSVPPARWHYASDRPKAEARRRRGLNHRPNRTTAEDSGVDAVTGMRRDKDYGATALE
jgi:hypothetical protein